MTLNPQVNNVVDPGRIGYVSRSLMFSVLNLIPYGRVSYVRIGEESIVYYIMEVIRRRPQQYLSVIRSLTKELRKRFIKGPESESCSR